MAGKKLTRGGAREQAERQVKEIRGFLEQWHALRTLVRNAYRGQTVDRESESEFLKIKNQLAMRHQYLLNWLDEDYLRKEPITPYLRNCVTLRMIQGYDDEYYKKLETEWHNTFLRLHQSLGHLRYMLDEEFA